MSLLNRVKSMSMSARIPSGTPSIHPEQPPSPTIAQTSKSRFHCNHRTRHAGGWLTGTMPASPPIACPRSSTPRAAQQQARVPCPIHTTHTPSQPPAAAGSSTVFPCHTDTGTGGTPPPPPTPQKERKGQRGIPPSRRRGLPREVYIDVLQRQYVFAAFTTSKTCSLSRLSFASPSFGCFRFGWPVVIWAGTGFSFSWAKCMRSELTECLSSYGFRACQCKQGPWQLHALFHFVLERICIVNHCDSNGAILTTPRASWPVGRPMTMPRG